MKLGPSHAAVAPYEARLATGELYDAFTLSKGVDGKSVMTEQIPDTPELRH